MEVSLPLFKKYLSLLMAAAFGGLCLTARQTPPVSASLAPPLTSKSPLEVIRCRAADLQNHPFQVDGLSVVLRCYRDRKLNGNWWFDLKVDNTTDGFISFNPQQLSVVNADGRQEQLDTDLMVLIAPGAFISTSYKYWFDNDLKMPARIYLGDRLLAEINKS